MQLQRQIALSAVLMAALAACGGGDRTAGGTSSAGATASGATSATVTATGTVHSVDMITDMTDGSNKFVPATLTVKRGDIIRFVLKMGVHNVSFPADSNIGKSGLPAAGPMLQAPGQTHDVPVTFGAGTYHFQCDPHAALGMVGKLTVQ